MGSNLRTKNHQHANIYIIDDDSDTPHISHLRS
jgi:hypothetical protein